MVLYEYSNGSSKASFKGFFSGIYEGGIRVIARITWAEGFLGFWELDLRFGVVLFASSWPGSGPNGLGFRV